MGNRYGWFDPTPGQLLGVQEAASPPSYARAVYTATGNPPVTPDPIPTGTWYNPPFRAGRPGHDNDVELLDLTDPANPTAISAGYYLVSTEFQPLHASLEDGKAAYFELDMDLNGEDANVAQVFSLGTGLTPFGSNDNLDNSLHLAWYVPAGGVINVAVQHDATAAVGYLLSLWVVRLG